MPINKNIQREHIFQAIIKLNLDNHPSANKIQTWGLEYENFLYPVKRLLSEANFFANGNYIDNSPKNFQSQMAVRYLIDLGFEILNYKTGEIFNLQNPY
jgi:hypothetical protein